jgi:NAD(P)-dependent dehydrogenase (short-subunit alcohol dehydrogenase family)
MVKVSANIYSSGIGLAAAKALAAKGLHIVAVDVSPELDAAVEQIKGVEGAGEVKGIKCDVSQIAQVEQLRDTVLKAFDGVC